MHEVEWVEAGIVKSTNAARRELRIAPAKGLKSPLLKAEAVALQHKGDKAERPLRCLVIGREEQTDQVICRLGAGTLRETVGAMKGGRVLIEAPATAEEEREWLPDDLVGCTLVGKDDAILGAVSDWFPTPAHPVLDVEQPAGGRFLLPLVPEVVEDIDLERSEVRVGDIEPFAVYDAN
jgi:ribosomal 30S subunit maturation factor RimM